jgi:fucose permease
MATLLLIIIYLVFISLGLPDSVLGSSFPAIAENLNIPSDYAGYIGMIVTSGTIVSALLSDFLIRKFTTKWVVSVSILLTVLGLIIFYITKAEFYYCLFIAAVPLGLGAGAIDSALNGYVALHYKAIHMNWLHMSWGVGASVSPLIIGSFIDSNNNSQGWNKGVLVIAIAQFVIAIIAFATLPIWNKVVSKQKSEIKEQNEEQEKEQVRVSTLFKMPIFYLALLGFFLYCGFETTTGVWTGRFLVQARGFSTSLAATLTSFFYLGIMFGRLVSGFVSLKLNEKTLMRIGEGIILIGVILAILPYFNGWLSAVGILIIGFGCAPIYPAIIRLTPYRFSKKYVQKATGLEMALAYSGNLIISPLFGLIAKNLGERYDLLPYVILVSCALMIICHEVINVKLKIRDKKLTEDEKLEYKTL